LTAIQAAVQVTDAVATRCPGNPEVNIAWAKLGGLFFSTAPSIPGSAANNVVASIRVVRRSDSTDPPDVLRVRSGLYHCTNMFCTTGSELYFSDLGPVKFGETVRLRLQWDRDNHRFIFQRDDDPEVLAPYTVSDIDPPGIQAKDLGALHLVPNCTATPRPVAFIDALFDDVMVNESATSAAQQFASQARSANGGQSGESFNSPLGEWSERYQDEGGQWKSSKVTIVDETKARYTNPNGQVFFYSIDDQGKWEGYWVESREDRCLEKKYGSNSWGVMVYQFNDAYNRYEGTWDWCGQGKKYFLKGVR
jgi:hypothetical protein